MPTRLESFHQPPHGVDHIGITVGLTSSSRYRYTRLRTINLCTRRRLRNSRSALRCLRVEQQLRRSFSPLLPLEWMMIRSPRHLRGINPRPTPCFHPSMMESSTRTPGGDRTVFPRTMPLPLHRLRRPPPPPTAPGNCPTLVVRLRIRVRGRRRMISGIRFRWSIMILPPPSLNNSLSHSRPTASLPRKSNNQSSRSRLRR